MTARSELPPSNPVARFRVRSLLWITTAAAVLAAIAGPYYRRQSPEAQDGLVGYWFCLLVFASLGLWRNWSMLWRESTPRRQLDFVLWSAPRRFWGPYWRFVSGCVFLLLCCLFVAGGSTHTVESVRSIGSGWLHTAFMGSFHGLIVSGCLMHFVPTPVFLTLKGISTRRDFTPWERVRTAEWAWSRSDVIRVRRLMGVDLYARVPLELQATLETYLRQKTDFIGRSVMEPAHDAAEH